MSSPDGPTGRSAPQVGAAPRTFAIRTFGCQMNEHDSERMAGSLLADGLVPTDDLESADVVVFNTCCVRENADNRFYGHLGNLKSLRERRPDMQIAVGGCLAQLNGEDIRRRAPHVDVVLGTHNLARLPALLRQASTDGPTVEVIGPSPRNHAAPDQQAGPDADEPDHSDDGRAAALAAVRVVPYAAWVTIQAGCDNSCAFCIVPAVRGPEVSRPFEVLVDEVGHLSRRGVTEVTLLGQNVNSYGRDLTRRRPLFADLLRAVGSVEGIRRLRFTSPHPKDLRPETIAAMAETPTVCNHLHLPLQSGSDAVLAAMRRGYTAERYLARLGAARQAIPDLAVTTDLIVGFPGEGDADFERTLEVVAEAAYDGAYTFIFSPRPGTRAAAMGEVFVPPQVVAERFERLRVVVERSALAAHRARIGDTEEVMVEGPSKRDPTTMTGRTSQNKLVHFQPPPDAPTPAPGSYAEIRVTAAAPHHLVGEWVVATAAAAHRRRIPVATAG